MSSIAIHPPVMPIVSEFCRFYPVAEDILMPQGDRGDWFDPAKGVTIEQEVAFRKARVEP
jgi:hypothetical protein